MEWLNLHISALDSAEFIRSAPTERATWLCLLRYSIGQENAGVIKGARSWGNRTWQQLCRVTLKEVNAETGLWVWHGEDLHVWAYPVDKEEEVKRNRTNGFKGGRPKSNRPVNQVDNQVVNPEKTTGFVSAETEGKGKEGNNTPIVPKGTGKGTLQLRAEKLMRRRVDTPLNAKERTAMRNSADAIKATTEQEWRALEAFYSAPQEQTYARKDLVTLLNNWNGEIDRAKAWCAKTGQLASVAKPPMTFALVEPIGWREYVDANLPNCAYASGMPKHGCAWSDVAPEHQAMITKNMREDGRL